MCIMIVYTLSIQLNSELEWIVEKLTVLEKFITIDLSQCLDKTVNGLPIYSFVQPISI